ncbi:hypothetical protein OPT61_g9596 [Boeremia exigua]|uniref:Uncharacterized protein n=1 Tax=Boeremia exigua TaxID=749465 RepID=A0ACC2HU86_9PLEO|nr:hypothetical protein OPT61_g9596 [Boeremia exigua]
MTCNNLRRAATRLGSATRDEQARGFRGDSSRDAVKARLSSATGRRCELARSSSSRLAGKQPLAAQQRQQQHCSNSEHLCDDGIGHPSPVDQVQLQLHSAPDVHRHGCLLPIRPQWRSDSSPASSQETHERLTWRQYVRHLAAPKPGHAAQPKHSSQSSPSVLGDTQRL